MMTQEIGLMDDEVTNNIWIVEVDKQQLPFLQPFPAPVTRSLSLVLG